MRQEGHQLLRLDMHAIDERPETTEETRGRSFRNGRQAMRIPEQQPSGPRLDFPYVSSHLRQEKPGYYLILLRNELRHRSLRRKCGAENEG